MRIVAQEILLYDNPMGGYKSVPNSKCVNNSVRQCQAQKCLAVGP